MKTNPIGRQLELSDVAKDINLFFQDTLMHRSKDGVKELMARIKEGWKSLDEADKALLKMAHDREQGTVHLTTIMIESGTVAIKETQKRLTDYIESEQDVLKVLDSLSAVKENLTNKSIPSLLTIERVNTYIEFWERTRDQITTHKRALEQHIDKISKDVYDEKEDSEKYVTDWHDAYVAGVQADRDQMEKNVAEWIILFEIEAEVFKNLLPNWYKTLKVEQFQNFKG